MEQLKKDNRKVYLVTFNDTQRSKPGTMLCIGLDEEDARKDFEKTREAIEHYSSSRLSWIKAEYMPQITIDAYWER